MEALSRNKNERRTNEIDIRRSTHPRLKAWPRGLRSAALQLRFAQNNNSRIVSERDSPLRSQSIRRRAH